LIAAGGSGRWVYALGYFQHVLYQFDTQTKTIQHVRVGSVGGHVSRNFLVDLNGHAYVPRIGHREAEKPGEPDTLDAELVEWDANLQELQAVPLPDYEASADFESHGIVGWTYLANGDLVFTTSSGGLWRIQPTNTNAVISRLGFFHPEGRSYPSSLFSVEGTRYVCGVALNPDGHYQWIVYDLQHSASQVQELNQEPFQNQRNLLLYGSNTRDNDGNGYLAGSTNEGPILLKIVFAKYPAGSITTTGATDPDTRESELAVV
jgi:hypothetical protein